MEEKVIPDSRSMVKGRKTQLPDRVYLSKESASKISRWHEQLMPHLCCSKLSRSDIVNWLLENHEMKLSDKIVEGMSESFFDPIKALDLATKEARLMTSNGEKVNINSLMISMLPQKMRRASKHKKSARKGETSENVFSEKE